MHAHFYIEAEYLFGNLEPLVGAQPRRPSNGFIIPQHVNVQFSCNPSRSADVSAGRRRREGEVAGAKDDIIWMRAPAPSRRKAHRLSCCYGYLQQIAERGRFRHQRRIREAEIRQGPDGAESHSAAESHKGGAAQEGR